MERCREGGGKVRVIDKGLDRFSCILLACHPNKSLLYETKSRALSHPEIPDHISGLLPGDHRSCPMWPLFWVTAGGLGTL